MELDVYREYQGSFQVVGHFDGEGSDVSFAYDREYFESVHAQALSYSLPLREEAFSAQEFRGFFEGLVPEGNARTSLARQFHLPPSAYLEMLSRLGRECIGALLFRNPDQDEDFSPSYETFSSETIEDLFSASSLATATQMGRSRLSLTGMQSKFGVYVDPDSSALSPLAWLDPRGSAPSTHIVKVAAENSGSLPYNELACMALAQACGIPVANSFAAMENERVFVSERFDRVVTERSGLVGGHIAPLRLHQEDFCQALGWPSYLKYEINDMVSYAIVVGNLLSRASSNAIEDKRQFVRRTAFDYLVGNCDNHLKNFSLLYSPSWTGRRLSPSYDIVSTTVLGFDRAMGFSVGDHRLIDEITLDDWGEFGKDIGTGASYAKGAIKEMSERVKVAADELLPTLPDKAACELGRIVEDMEGRLVS